MERRYFFTTGLVNYFKDLVKNIDPDALKDDENKEKDYFESFYSCYPILSECSYEQIVEAAKEKGIDVTDKSKLELAKEIWGNNSRRQS